MPEWQGTQSGHKNVGELLHHDAYVKCMMNKETLEALRDSIQKWEDIIAGKILDEGTENCPLCGLFFDKDCRGCPVAEATYDYSCGSSPYWAWARSEVKYTNDYDPSTITEEGKELAQAELDFLISLLPENTK